MRTKDSAPSATVAYDRAARTTLPKPVVISKYLLLQLLGGSTYELADAEISDFGDVVGSNLVDTPIPPQPQPRPRRRAYVCAPAPDPSKYINVWGGQQQRQQQHQQHQHEQQ